MVMDECEMIEKKDLANPKQAQKELDIIMEDSRMGFEWCKSLVTNKRLHWMEL